MTGINDLYKQAAMRRPFPPHKTLAEKLRGLRYEECHLVNTCDNGFGQCEECWYDSEDYWYDVGPGAPTVKEFNKWKLKHASEVFDVL